MDPVEKMLIEKYGIDPTDAYNMALDIRHNGERTGNQGDFTNKLAKQEAYTDIANKEIADLQRFAKNAEAFTRMHKVKQEGGALPEADEKWYQLVLNKQRERYTQTADLRTKQINSVAMDGAHASKVRGNQMARVAFDGIENTNQLVNQAMQQRDTRLATEQTSRDQIANQLIRQYQQPPNVMPPVQMQVQPDYQGFDAGAANMDPQLAAYVNQMMQQGGRR